MSTACYFLTHSNVTVGSSGRSEKYTLMYVVSHYCFNMVAERWLPTGHEKEERGVVVQAEVEASATNSDGHDIPVFDMSSGDAEDKERESRPPRTRVT